MFKRNRPMAIMVFIVAMLLSIGFVAQAQETQIGVTWCGAVFAMLSLSLLPVLAVFILFQRYIVEGIATSGLKG